MECIRHELTAKIIVRRNVGYPIPRISEMSRNWTNRTRFVDYKKLLGWGK